MAKIIRPKDDTTLVNLVEDLTRRIPDSIAFLKSNELKVCLSKIKTEKDLEKLNKIKIATIFLIKESCQNLSLFKNEGIVSCFKELGFTNMELYWLFDNYELMKKFKIMTNSGIIESLNITEIIKIIYFYACVMIDITLINKFKVVDRNEKIVINSNLMKAELQNIIQKSRYRENSQKNFKQNDFEVYWNELNKIELMHKKLGISIEKYLKTILSKTDNMLINIFIKYITFKDTDQLGNKVSMNKKYQIAYPLFQYLMPHRDNWYKNEIEYKKSNDNSGYSFDMLMAKRMERYIKKDTLKKI